VGIIYTFQFVKVLKYKLNIHISPTTITNSSRIFRECDSLLKQDLVDKIIIIGFFEKNFKKIEKKGESISVFRINTLFGKQRIFLPISFLIFYLRTFIVLLKYKPAIVNCHTLTVLPIGYLYKILKPSTLLIYDAHELETETDYIKGIRKKISKWLEKKMIIKVDRMIVVSDKIAEWYKKIYGIKNIQVIRNVPKQISSFDKVDIKALLGIPKEELLFIYQGALEKQRGIQLMIDVFKNSKKDRHIVFLGEGELTEHVKEFTIHESNIHYLKPVAHNQVLSYTSGADVGLNLLRGSCLNHQYCLPNKVFEYLLAGIPFISSNFPSLVDEFSDYNFAWFIEPEYTKLISLVNSLTIDDVQEYKRNCIMHKNLWDWNVEEKTFLKVYN